MDGRVARTNASFTSSASCVIRTSSIDGEAMLVELVYLNKDDNIGHSFYFVREDT